MVRFGLSRISTQLNLNKIISIKLKPDKTIEWKEKTIETTIDSNSFTKFKPTLSTNKIEQFNLVASESLARYGNQ